MVAVMTMAPGHSGERRREKGKGRADLAASFCLNFAKKKKIPNLLGIF